MSDKTQETEMVTPGELDVGSEQFNPLRALYATDYKVTEKAPNVLYQNLAAFESALLRVGVWQLNKRQKSIEVEGAANSQNSACLKEDMTKRRFKSHQMAIEGTANMKRLRNLYTHMASAEGPLAFLQKNLPAPEGLGRTKLRVYVRKQQSIGGTIEGDLVAYDKQWNLLLKNAVEIWQRRKYKYGEQKICGNPASEVCSARLRQLGIALPFVEIKSLNRKNVQLRREIPLVMVRGENVVLISLKD